MSKITIKIINKSKNNLPEYQTSGSAAMDICADIENPEFTIVLTPGSRVLIKTGLFVEIPDGYHIDIRPRSGLAYKNGITVLNSHGCVDSDYRGEIGVILVNHSTENFNINQGDRIAQLSLVKTEKIKWQQVNDISKSDRDTGGFGSTGIK